MTTAAATRESTAGPGARRALLRALEARFGLSMLVANAVGAGVVFLLLGFLLPVKQRFLQANVIALLAYMAFALLCGWALSARAFAPLDEWASGRRPIGSGDRTYVARHPFRQAVINFTLWVGSLCVFVPINARFGARNDASVASTILLGGLTTCGLTYLLAQRILRPLNEIAFAERLPSGRYLLGVKARLLLAWALGTGIPLFGVVLMAVRPGPGPLSLPGLAFLGSIGLVSGAVSIVYAAKAIADPIESVTTALSAVEADRLDVTVPVYDGSEVGRLQLGFNAMVAGLRERRELRDLFGRQVGEDVAEQALRRGTRLGGEQVHAAVLFVDIIGSTALAAQAEPDLVVERLNTFFAIVVDVVDRAGGFVNKFEGDAALCVFGAPVPRQDADACALSAARVLRTRLRAVPDLGAAIGVSAGTVVAGNLGTAARFEYTVIGDPVNEAARLTELAKTRPEALLASAALLDAAPAEERERWQIEGEVVLRGRTAPTVLAVPR